MQKSNLSKFKDLPKVELKFTETEIKLLGKINIDLLIERDFIIVVIPELKYRPPIFVQEGYI